MRSGCLVFLLGCGLLAAESATAQIAPRVTGATVIAQLETVRQDLAARASQIHDDRLAGTATRLGSMADALRKSLGDKASQPVEIISDSARVAVLRGEAAAERTRAYLDAVPGCPGADAKAMADGLAATVDKLATAKDSAKFAPVISSIETMDHHPLFALHPGTTPIALALVGSNLSDTQCADPQVTVTDEHGKPLGIQPVVTGVLPTRIELKLPSGAGNEPGTFVLHVVPKHKGFLMGCSAQPEALAVLQVAQPLRISVAYTLAATCNGANIPVSSGSLPDIVAYGTMTTRQVDTAACANPSRYAVSAKVTFGDGSSASAGPVEQSADADITMGLPAGLSLSWSPSTRTVSVRSSAAMCKGVN